MIKYSLVLVFLLINTSCLAVDISHDGRSVEIMPGGEKVKWVSLLNREELPRWVKVTIQSTGPMFGPKSEELASPNTAPGWTTVREDWFKVLPNKLEKLRVEFLPPAKTKVGEYVVWLQLDQMNTSPRALGEEQRGKSLEARITRTYYLPVVIRVYKEG